MGCLKMTGVYERVVDHYEEWQPDEPDDVCSWILVHKGNVWAHHAFVWRNGFTIGRYDRIEDVVDYPDTHTIVWSSGKRKLVTATATASDGYLFTEIRIGVG